MKIIFMGTPEFSLVSLQLLHAQNFNILAVVTQPDKPQGRKNIIVPPPVKKYALEKNIPVHQPDNVEDITDELKALGPDFIVTAAFGQILRRKTLDIPRLACVNLHASLLPLYRGASPIQCAIVNGETETGVTTMIMDEGLDTGPILLQDRVPIDPDETADTLHIKLAAVGAQLLVRTLVEFDNITPQPQDNNTATCTKVLCKGHGAIDWKLPAADIHNLVRGYSCWPSAFTRLNGKRIIIWRTTPLDAIPPNTIPPNTTSPNTTSPNTTSPKTAASESPAPQSTTTATNSHEVAAPQSAPLGDTVPESAKPGQVVSCDKEKGILIAAGAGLISVLELQREGKKRQTFDEFLRGFPLKPGDIFETE